MKKLQEKKCKSGITLIALAITVVVLIVLAGVSINAVVGDDGIIKKAQESANLTKESEAKEIINRAVLEFRLTEGYDTLEDFLRTKVSNGKIDSVINNGDGTLNVSKNGYTVTVENKTKSSNNSNNKTIKISATPYTGTYDGNEHEAITNVNVEPTDAKIEYSTDGVNYSTEVPTITNAGTMSITVRASKENYETKTVSVTAKIEKAEGRLVLSETSGTISNPGETTFNVSENTGALSVGSLNTDVATASVSGSIVTVKSVGAGSATITVTSAESINYNAKSATYTVTVKNSTFTGDSGVGYYADTDGDGTPDGIIFADFKNGGSGSWGGTNYTISTVTDLKEYYVSQTNYNGPFGTKDVLTSSGSGNARFNVMALSDYENSAIYTFPDANNITSGEWGTQSIETWAMFAGQLGITTSNYSEYGLTEKYWSSTGYVKFYNYGYYINFGDGNIDSDYRSAKYSVRLFRTF